MEQPEEFLVHLARSAVLGKRDESVAHIRRAARRLQGSHPKISKELESLLINENQRANLERAVPVAELRSPLPLPVDSDSRLELIRREDPVVLDNAPIFSATLESQLNSILLERSNAERLSKAGLVPSRSLLVTGPPGVGKTYTARWIADELGFPLLTLDLSAVMSSFLGRTGSNLRTVLDYARATPCVMLLDEFDACAKRRDDATEIGELKRLVTVLLQAVDDWPASGFLIAATNHPDLLDPAVWRRFDHVISFGLPDKRELENAVRLFIGDSIQITAEWVQLLVEAFRGRSIADIKRSLVAVRRKVLLTGSGVEQAVCEALQGITESLSQKERLRIAKSLESKGLSERRISAMTGVSRDTMRKYRSK